MAPFVEVHLEVLFESLQVAPDLALKVLQLPVRCVVCVVTAATCNLLQERADHHQLRVGIQGSHRLQQLEQLDLDILPTHYQLALHVVLPSNRLPYGDVVSFLSCAL
jgi:hypothetical protein